MILILKFRLLKIDIHQDTIIPHNVNLVLNYLNNHISIQITKNRYLSRQD
jgi:hypothetical protein